MAHEAQGEIIDPADPWLWPLWECLSLLSLNGTYSNHLVCVWKCGLIIFVFLGNKNEVIRWECESEKFG